MTTRRPDTTGNTGGVGLPQTAGQAPLPCSPGLRSYKYFAVQTRRRHHGRRRGPHAGPCRLVLLAALARGCQLPHEQAGPCGTPPPPHTPSRVSRPSRPALLLVGASPSWRRGDAALPLFQVTPLLLVPASCKDHPCAAMSWSVTLAFVSPPPLPQGLAMSCKHPGRSTRGPLISLSCRRPSSRARRVR